MRVVQVIGSDRSRTPVAEGIAGALAALACHEGQQLYAAFKATALAPADDGTSAGESRGAGSA
jgi:hypothetical protein